MGTTTANSDDELISELEKVFRADPEVLKMYEIRRCSVCGREMVARKRRYCSPLCRRYGGLLNNLEKHLRQGTLNGKMKKLLDWVRAKREHFRRAIKLELDTIRMAGIL
jgi:hypothetical protein